MWMIKKKVKGNSSGQMEESTWEAGLKENSMEKVSIFTQVGKVKMEFGKMDKEQGG